MTMGTYNGWANYETWNVALWIGNDEGLYNMAKGYTKAAGYTALSNDLSDFHSTSTPDGVSWKHPDLDITALDEMLEEL